tara:strand:- start:185 stop:403 length:219 start_codon:yes stop_codon:yes gene_type:complete
MSEINYQQLNILTKEQLLNLLNTIINKAHQSMNNDQELINLFNKNYKINKQLDKYEKGELIDLIISFKPNSK